MNIYIDPSKKTWHPKIRFFEMFTKSSKISINLMRKLSCMTNDQSTEWSILLID